MYNRLGIWQSALDTSPSDPASEKTIELVTGSHDAAETPHTYLSIPLEMIPTDVALPCALYVRISEKFVLFRKTGDVLTFARAQSLIGPSNGMIYVSLQEWNRLLHSLEAVIIAGQHATGIEAETEHGLHIRNLLLAYAREIEHKKELNAPQLERIRVLADQLTAIIYHRPELTTALLRRYQEPALYYVNHAINVAIYSIAIAKKQGLPLAGIQPLAFAALVHNVGNILVPAELLYKPGELTVSEKQQVDGHILHGAQLLQTMVAPKEVILTAMHHHDRYDGQGGNLTHSAGDEIHLYARICSIADVFDAVTSCRPYHTHPMNPDTAVALMREMKGKFDPKILPMVAEEHKKKH